MRSGSLLLLLVLRRFHLARADVSWRLSHDNCRLTHVALMRVDHSTTHRSAPSSQLRRTSNIFTSVLHQPCKDCTAMVSFSILTVLSLAVSIAPSAAFAPASLVVSRLVVSLSKQNSVCRFVSVSISTANLSICEYLSRCAVRSHSPFVSFALYRLR